MADILEIEIRRQDAGLSKGRLCRAAGINRATYHRLLTKPGSGRAASVARLQTAITVLAKEQRA
jgi:hypothetical protein